MEAIDQAPFNFSPKIGLAVAVMVGFLVFAVALDLTRDQFRGVLSKPKAPSIGLVAQYLILPGVAFGIGLLMADTPSIALGLLLVACCPAGALSNYLTGVARGSVATSVSMTAVSTLLSDRNYAAISRASRSGRGLLARSVSERHCEPRPRPACLPRRPGRRPSRRVSAQRDSGTRSARRSSASHRNRSWAL